MRRFSAPWRWLQRAGAAWQRRHALGHRLAELDERTLRDVGLEVWRGPLGARVLVERGGQRPANSLL